MLWVCYDMFHGVHADFLAALACQDSSKLARRLPLRGTTSLTEPSYHPAPVPSLVGYEALHIYALCTYGVCVFQGIHSTPCASGFLVSRCSLVNIHKTRNPDQISRLDGDLKRKIQDSIYDACSSRVRLSKPSST